MSSFKANISASRLSTRRCQMLALIVAFTVGTIWSAVGEPNDRSPTPQLGEFTIKGLDVRHNKIDQIIGRFGFICIIHPAVKEPCTIERELISYLRTLPPKQTDIERELIALGAACERKNSRLDCIYERHVEKSVGFAGALEPEAIIDEFFRIDFAVVQNGGSLNYAAKFDRKQKVKWRRGDAKGI